MAHGANAAGLLDKLAASLGAPQGAATELLARGGGPLPRATERGPRAEEELRASALCGLVALGVSPPARRTCELLLGRLSSSRALSPGYAGAHAVVLLLARAPGGMAEPSPATLATRALYRAGEASSSHSAGAFFHRRAVVSPQVPPGAFPGLCEDDSLFAEPDPEEPARAPSFAGAAQPAASALSRWFERPRRDGAEVLFRIPGLEEPELEPEAEPRLESKDADVAAPPARDVAARHLSVQKLRRRRRVAWERYRSWDASWEASKGGLSKLRALWLSCAARVQERALWEHPHGLGLLSCLGEDGSGWVRAAGLALHGVPSEFFEVQREEPCSKPDPGRGLAGRRLALVTFRGRQGRCGMESLSRDWAELCSSVLRLRRLSEALLHEDCSAVTEQAFGGALRHILGAFDQAVEILGPGGVGLTPLMLWSRTRPWARQIQELAGLCGVDGEPGAPVAGVQLRGLVLLEHLFYRCHAREVSAGRWNVKAETSKTPSFQGQLACQYVLQQTLEPYLRFVTAWAYRGELVDVCREFTGPGGTQAAVPSFLRSSFTAINKSGNLLRMLLATKSALRSVLAGGGLDPDSNRAVEYAGGLGRFFEESACTRCATGFLPKRMVAPGAKGSVEGEDSQLPELSLNHPAMESKLGEQGGTPLASSPEAVAGPGARRLLALRCSLRAHGEPEAMQVQRSPSPTVADEAASEPARSGRAAISALPLPSQSEEAAEHAQPGPTPESERPAPSTRGRAEAASAAGRACLLEAAEKRERQRFLREQLEEQMQQQRHKREAAAAARREPPEALLLEVQATPDDLQAAREQLLAEHQQEMSAYAAEAARLEHQLHQGLDATQQLAGPAPSQRSAKEEPDTLAEASTTLNQSDAWGAAVNPFDNSRNKGGAAAYEPSDAETASWGPAMNPLASFSIDSVDARAPSDAETASWGPALNPFGSGSKMSARGLQLQSGSDSASEVSSISVRRSHDEAASGRLGEKLLPELASPLSSLSLSSARGLAGAGALGGSKEAMGTLAEGDDEDAIAVPRGEALRPAESAWAAGRIASLEALDTQSEVSHAGQWGEVVQPFVCAAARGAEAAPHPQDRGLGKQNSGGDPVARMALRAAYAAVAARGAAGPSAEEGAAHPRQARPPGPRASASRASGSGSILIRRSRFLALVQERDAHPQVGHVDCAQDASWAAEAGAAPLQACLEQCVFRPLRLQARAVDAAVACQFVEDLQLMKRLRLLRRYVLMGESRLFEPFIGGLDRFALAHVRGSSAFGLVGLEGSLNLFFQAAIPRPPDPEDDAFLGAVHLAVKMPAAPAADCQIQWRFLECVNVGLSTKFPLDMVFSDHAMEQYTRLFRLLVLLHYALDSVKQAWFHGICVASVPISALVLRQHMHFFVSTLQRYLLADVISAEFAKLEARVDAAESLDSILGAHGQFLRACERKAFLGSDDSGVFETIVAMLHEVIELGAMFQDLGEADAMSMHSQIDVANIAFQDLRRKLKLSLPGTGVARFAGDDDFLEAWLSAWSERCER